ncbi:uncharacterized protein MONOS_14035c2 [Monocercomonoides exilis]|uniref:uncharacterized protein n=1 Tax=Monocercomonoides exilis TaxID=2049356 RepID=UPI00355AB7CA|nr:hypothetical protein MONOS_14035c1 [Monocercomonoides exilis]KAH7819027.1 hypothetical protein MONOS_14035c2 [Monocercomonoides exilis]|eukprot:MONOS_14035.1-p1 / transcript=MONOS_14035.1 / gene=MONOS_14035 / organism=Monocercomonoides_exilis_PA203 / gene_product=unspecified product / transcript_product=unspecified product / location=Mono_scaffold00925:17916-18431(+) / protein_length=172 / sequence_SO=supercontig / SO=protein_coding / is_pseudo=false
MRELLWKKEGSQEENVAGSVPLVESTPMGLMTSTEFESTEHVANETAYELLIPITLQSFVQMKCLLKPQKIGLQPSLVWKLTLILGIFGDKIATDLGEGSAVLARVVVPRQWFWDFVFMWLRVKHAAQKKSEAAILRMIFVVKLFPNDFADVLLLGKFVREESKGDKLWFS